MSTNKEEFSIGEVAETTGISVHTLRQWERRYGSPRPLKRNSGHRRYSADEVARLRLVQQVLICGFRAKEAVPLPSEKLLALLKLQNADSQVFVVEEWLNCVKNWDEKQLASLIQNDWKNLGPLSFLQQRAVPFLKRIGESWSYGEISVSQEHFFSELLQSFLSSKWRKLNQQNKGNIFVLACPEGENHYLGLHMCALILTLNHNQVYFLGDSTPTDDILKVCEHKVVRGLCLSFSSAYDSLKAKDIISKIKKKLRQNVILIIGGQGAPKNLSHVFQFNDLLRFNSWLIDNPHI